MNRPRAEQLALDLGHRPALGREDFLVAPSNADAVAWIDHWPDWPGPCLVIHGPEGSGKTHLAHVWRAISGAAAIDAAAPDAAARLRSLAEAPSAVVVENAKLVRHEAALFHLHNAAGEQGTHLLLTARRPPAAWRDGLPDLLSRLRSAPAVGLTPPDDALMAAVLAKQFADRQIRVGNDVIAYLVTRLERSFAAARQAVEDIDRAALAEKRNVTVPLVREILRREE